MLNENIKQNSASCHCKANIIETVNNAKSFWVGACHCNDCKKISGSPYMAYIAFKLEEINFINKNLQKYKSSENVTRSFCSNCGSPISFVYNNKKQDIFLTLGIFDNPDDFKIVEHIFVAGKMKHVFIQEEIKQSQ